MWSCHARCCITRPNSNPTVNEQLKVRLVERAGERRRFGYRRLYAQAGARRIRELTIVDDFTKEATDLVAEFSIPDVTRHVSRSGGTFPGLADGDSN